MTFSICMNQPKMIEWNLSWNGGALLSIMSELSSWATPITVENNTYYLLFRKKIQEELPMLGKSISSISRTINELETKGLIESVQKNSTPAYRLSEKGKEWRRSISNTNVGESIETEDKESVISPVKKNKNKPFTFTLYKRTGYDSLSLEYKEKLKISCEMYAKKENIPCGEFEYFADWHSSHGSSFKNWGTAFRNWCRKYKEIEKSNGGESSKDEYFSNNGKGLY